MPKKITAPWYTESKSGWSTHNHEFIECRNDPFLYSKGRYTTCITREDLPEWYAEIYLRRKMFVSAKGITDIVYEPNFFSDNHLFKDDFLYISWSGTKIQIQDGPHSLGLYDGYDLLLWGWGVKHFVDFAIPYAEGEMREKLESIKERIEQKIVWYVHMNPERWELSLGYEDIHPKVTFLTRPMDKLCRPLSTAEQLAAMEEFCTKHHCKHIGTIRVETEADVAAIANALPRLQAGDPVRPIFLYAYTRNYSDKGEDPMERILDRHFQKCKATLTPVYMLKKTSACAENEDGVDTAWQ